MLSLLKMEYPIPMSSQLGLSNMEMEMGFDGTPARAIETSSTDHNKMTK
jgi:hypothetical protein